MRRTGSTAWSRYVLAVILLSPLCLAAQGGAPPDGAALLREVRNHLRVDTLGEYAYVQRETQVKLDGDGNVTAKSTRIFEIYPGRAGVGTYKRLVSRDGVPLPAEELQRNDRKRDEEVDAAIQRLRSETSSDREKHARETASERNERESQIDDVFRVYDFRLVGRDVISGRPALVVSFSARPGANPTTRYGSIARKFAGKAWIDEAEHEIVRVEGRAVEDVTYGFGIFARVNQGTTVSWERAKVDGEAWVPTHLEVKASGRILLFRRLGLHLTTDYFDYRRAPAAMAYSLAPAR